MTFDPDSEPKTILNHKMEEATPDQDKESRPNFPKIPAPKKTPKTEDSDQSEAETNEINKIEPERCKKRKLGGQLLHGIGQSLDETQDGTAPDMEVQVSAQ